MSNSTAKAPAIIEIPGLDTVHCWSRVRSRVDCGGRGGGERGRQGGGEGGRGEGGKEGGMEGEGGGRERDRQTDREGVVIES